jgi:rubrerythrin
VFPDLIGALAAARAAEKSQALFYRALAAEAEARGDRALAERLNELHADEQHHFARLSARMMELGEDPVDVRGTSGDGGELDGWEARAQRREEAEVLRYESLLQRDLDTETRALAEQILATEKHHAQVLAGKWTLA